MDDQSFLCGHLRERAARCRELARGAYSIGVACELESIADEYERDAELLEARPRPAGAHPHAA